MAVQTGLSEGLAYDRQQFVSLLDTDDTEVGIRTSQEDGYEPKFTGQKGGHTSGQTGLRCTDSVSIIGYSNYRISITNFLAYEEREFTERGRINYIAASRRTLDTACT